MIPDYLQLHPTLFDTDTLESVPTRNGFGDGLVIAADEDPRVVGICADLAESTRMHLLKEKYPDRYIEVGVAEQNLATVASGMAQYGKIPFMTSYATFSPGRNNEQIRTTIAINKVPVKIIGSHAGVSVGPDGATHQALEDIALMRVMPHMTVVVPVDANQARKATIAIAKTDTPVYMRLARAGSPVFTTDDTPFEIGKAYVYFEERDSDVTILATGNLVYSALCVAHELLAEHIAVSVVAVPTIKPLDEETILAQVERARAVVTVEEHQVAGGFGSAIAELLGRTVPTPIEYIGVHDQFGQSGTPEELIQYYGMGVNHIKDAVKKVLKRKSTQ